MSKLDHFGGERKIGGKKEKKRKKRKERGRKGGVRRSNFSLDSMKIGLSVFVEAIGKVCLRNESFAWVREFGVFDKLQEVEVFDKLREFGSILAEQFKWHELWGREWCVVNARIF